MRAGLRSTLRGLRSATFRTSLAYSPLILSLRSALLLLRSATFRPLLAIPLCVLAYVPLRGDYVPLRSGPLWPIPPVILSLRSALLLLRSATFRPLLAIPLCALAYVPLSPFGKLYYYTPTGREGREGWVRGRVKRFQGN